MSLIILRYPPPSPPPPTDGMISLAIRSVTALLLKHVSDDFADLVYTVVHFFFFIFLMFTVSCWHFCSFNLCILIHNCSTDSRTPQIFPFFTLSLGWTKDFPQRVMCGRIDTAMLCFWIFVVLLFFVLFFFCCCFLFCCFVLFVCFFVFFFFVFFFVFFVLFFFLFFFLVCFCTTIDSRYLDLAYLE